MTRWVALVRGVVAATHARMPMVALRERAEAEGFRRVRTVLASGNLVFDRDASEGEVASALAGLVDGFGLDNPVVLRRQAELEAIRAACPFPDAAGARPGKLLVHFLPRPASGPTNWDGPERIAVRGREVFVDYADGIGRSKLTTVRLDRLVGPGGTARNWNTLGKLVRA